MFVSIQGVMGKSEAPEDDGSVVPGYTPELGTRLSLVIEQIGTQAMAAKIADVTAEQLRSWRDGKARMAFGGILRLCDAANVSLDWFATGEGPVTRTGVVESQALSQSGPPGEGFVLVPRYDVEASAGPGTFADSERVVDHMAFRDDWVRRTLRVDPARLVLITAVGDSMEPVIRGGDLLLIDTSVDRIVDDAIYVLVKRDELVVKRVQQFFTGAVTIKSDNPAYVEETLSPEEAEQVHVAGRLRWIARLL